MTKNFTYLALLCSFSMLLIIGGVLLAKLPVIVQILMISIGLILGIVCFISLIRLLVTQNK
ncbi:MULTISPECIES: sodium:potassium antiporter [Bacillales]|uniref:Sodium:potassium antiporter n=1 Tax=Lysinibacillus louembei TaxID=1470088 RepID=A0ABZ0S0Y8_9BACI|nr:MULTISPECIES: sodium:potassium antiporter [Bacillales]MCT6926012.1 sodium:potassium antiporter [Metasolibacillus sp.]MCT6942247.1 sodium:potassium antiporter [Metasolibacillus sp.]WPK12921.1 sodium:potassium antiporter [Lysinibacillus louembei]